MMMVVVVVVVMVVVIMLGGSAKELMMVMVLRFCLVFANYLFFVILNQKKLLRYENTHGKYARTDR